MTTPTRKALVLGALTGACLAFWALLCSGGLLLFGWPS